MGSGGQRSVKSRAAGGGATTVAAAATSAVSTGGGGAVGRGQGEEIKKQISRNPEKSGLFFVCKKARIICLTIYCTTV